MKIFSFCCLSIFLLIGTSMRAQSSGGSFVEIIAGPDFITECTDGIPTEYPYEVNNNCGEYTVTVDFDIAPIGCGGSFRQTFIYMVTNDCGDTDLDVQVVDYLDTEPPVILMEPEFTVECNEPYPPIENYEIFDCSNVDVVYSEAFLPQCGNTFSLLRSYIATDDCGNSTTAAQTIIVQDTQSPVLSDEPSDIFLQCPEDLNPPPIITAIDYCTGDVDVFYYETDPFGGCEAENAILPPDQEWSFFFGGLPADINVRFIWDASGALVTHYQNQLVITGIIHAVDDIDQQFSVFIVGTNGTDWTGWNSQTTIGGGINRTYRDSYGFAAAAGDAWMNWEFFEIDGSASFMSGQGSLAGSYVSLTHAPSNYLFGLQFGEAASDQSPNFGVSSWMNMEGQVNGEPVLPQSQCSFSSDVACYAVGGTCGFSYSRNWVAHDGCGNMTSHSQMVNVLDDTPPVITCPTDQLLACGTDYSPESVGMAVAVDNCNQGAFLDYIDIGDGGECPGEVTRFWSTGDLCGNMNECTQTIVFQDDPGDPCPADINNDNFVDIDDFIALNSAYGTFCIGCTEDINGDGVVGIDDFIALNSAFGFPCPEFIVDSDRSIQLLDEIDRLGIRSDIDGKLMKMIDSPIAISLFPNPNDGSFRLTVDLPKDESIVSYEILDLTGKVVHDAIFLPQNGIINHDLSPGSYLVNVKSNGLIIGATILTVLR